jgi:hypothetical protein
LVKFRLTLINSSERVLIPAGTDFIQNPVVHLQMDRMEINGAEEAAHHVRALNEREKHHGSHLMALRVLPSGPIEDHRGVQSD